jgi:hypothetical protein
LEHFQEEAAMSCISLVATAVVATGILSACATTSTMNGGEPKGAAALPPCEELEGYPDCQDGHQVDPRLASLSDH